MARCSEKSMYELVSALEGFKTLNVGSISVELILYPMGSLPGALEEQDLLGTGGDPHETSEARFRGPGKAWSPQTAWHFGVP